MQEEVWKQVPNFDKYYISNLGRIKSTQKFHGTNERILNPSVDHYGYLVLFLVKDKKKYHKKVHRLVAEAFIPNPENKPQIDHINTVKTDNRVENLRWVDSSENRLNPITRKKCLGYSRRTIKIAVEKNYKYFICEDTGEIVKGAFNLSKKLGIERGTLRKKVNNKERIKGFLWKQLNK